MKTISKCPICGSKPIFTAEKRININKADVYLKVALREYYLGLWRDEKPSETLSICGDCYSVYRARFFDEDEIREVYGHLYYEIEKEFIEQASYVYNNKEFLDGSAIKMFEAVKRVEKKYSTSINRIFDIGGRDGFRVSKLANDGYDCTVYDPIECEPCNSNIKKSNKWLSDIPSNEKADLIVLYNVLEHCTEPSTVIQSCYKHLNDMGAIIVELPCDLKPALFWIFIKRFFGYNLSIDDTHGAFYSIKGIKHLLQTNGFIDIEYNVSALPSYSINHIEISARKGKVDIGVEVNRNFVSSLIRSSRKVKKLPFIVEKCIGKSVLDLGCVRHNATFALTDPNWLHKNIGLVASYLVGVDYLKQDVDELNKQGYNLIYGDVSSPLNINEKFDLIVAGDLIEHLTNFDGFLENIKRLIKEEGRIVISTPNPFFIDLFFFVALKREYIINPEHTCWIDPQALSQLLARYNMSIEEIHFLEPSWSFLELLTYNRTSNDFDILLGVWKNQSVFYRVYRTIVIIISKVFLMPLWFLFKLLTPINSRMTSCSDYVVVIKNNT